MAKYLAVIRDHIIAHQYFPKRSIKLVRGKINPLKTKLHYSIIAVWLGAKEGISRADSKVWKEAIYSSSLSYMDSLRQAMLSSSLIPVSAYFHEDYTS